MEILLTLQMAEVVEVQVGMLPITVPKQLNQHNQEIQVHKDLVTQVVMYQVLHGTVAVAAVVPVQLAKMVVAEVRVQKQQVMVV